MRASQIFALAAALPSVLAAYKGFNYGSTFSDGSTKFESDFEGEFNAAKNLVGASGFTSARLFTTIQDGTTNSPISAIPAAITTNTTLLLGLWASAGDAQFANEVAALSAAISQYGSALTDLIAGISVGSEDIYRITPIGVESNAGTGAEPSTIINYIDQVRTLIAGTSANAAPVGHVDTYNVWTNSSQNALIGAVDFIGMDAYPYYENTKENSIENANATFFDDYDVTVAVAQGKPVWVTETGWPTAGPTENLAVASIDNAQTYWHEVGCSLFNGDINTWYFILQDNQPVTPNPTFAIVGAGNPPPTTPLFDLSC